MSRRTLLTAEQRARLFAIPTDPAEMARHYVLGTEDLALIRSKRRGMNRLGFAVQLCLLRYPGQGLGPGEHPPRAHIATQTQAPENAVGQVTPHTSLLNDGQKTIPVNIAAPTCPIPAA